MRRGHGGRRRRDPASDSHPVPREEFEDWTESELCNYSKDLKDAFHRRDFRSEGQVEGMCWTLQNILGIIKERAGNGRGGRRGGGGDGGDRGGPRMGPNRGGMGASPRMGGFDFDPDMDEESFYYFEYHGPEGSARGGGPGRGFGAGMGGFGMGPDMDDGGSGNPAGLPDWFFGRAPPPWEDEDDIIEEHPRRSRNGPRSSCPSRQPPPTSPPPRRGGNGPRPEGRPTFGSPRRGGNEPRASRPSRSARDLPPGASATDSNLDLYRALGLSRNATIDQVRDAYKKAALKWHPDKHISADAHGKEMAKKKFVQANKAYQWLSDEKKRKFYNAMGSCNDDDFEQWQYCKEPDFKEFQDMLEDRADAEENMPRGGRGGLYEPGGNSFEDMFDRNGQSGYGRSPFQSERMGGPRFGGPGFGGPGFGGPGFGRGFGGPGFGGGPFGGNPFGY